ncbi:uncharacterized protein [Nicotiana tomentosiformis]|uniref:uncharacterized protein isoform X2 n=1 Tax=Nicotiana tomentosiformis TaxID=4098 RepID=UPI00388CB53B
MDTVKTIVKGKICQKSFLFPEFNIKKKKIKSDLCRNEMFCHNSAHIPPCEQYRQMGLKKYSELISYLLVAEQHNELLMKNHESRPTGSCPFPEVNETNFHQAKRGRGRGPSRGHGRSRGGNSNRGNNNAPKNPPHYQQWKRKEQKYEAVQAAKPENACYRCGGKRHWSRTCRMPKHLVELYQASLKKTEKNAEANFISEDNLDFMHLDVADYITLLEGETSHVIGSESVEM